MSNYCYNIRSHIANVHINNTQQTLWDKIHLAKGIIEFLTGLCNDLTNWQIQENQADCGSLWLRVRNYHYLNKLMANTDDMSKMWRYNYFYNALHYGKQIITADLVCANRYLESSVAQFKTHLEDLETASAKSSKVPYNTSIYRDFLSKIATKSPLPYNLSFT